MRTVTVTKTYKIYTFDELTENAKEKVRQCRIEDTIYMRQSDLQDILDNELDIMFGSDNHALKVQYSLSNCQGDGVNIYGKVNTSAFLKYAKKHFEPDELKILHAYAKEFEELEIPYNKKYTYSKANETSFYYEWLDSLECGCYKNINKKLILKAESIFCEVFYELCKKFEEFGYDYLYNISDDEFFEDWFLEDGTLFEE